MGIGEAWENLEIWLKAEAPMILEALRPGASDERLRAAEEAAGIPFPEQLMSIYRRHDGQETGSPGLFDTGEFLSLDRVLQIRSEKLGFFQSHPDWNMNGLPPAAEPGIRAVWWSEGWLPLVATGRGDFLCVDLDPAPGGSRGQIIRVWDDDPARERRAGSIVDWFSSKVQRILRGDYVHSGDHHGLMLLEDL